MKIPTFLLVALLILNRATAQDIVITIGADHKPVVQIAENPKRLVLKTTNAATLSAVLVRNKSDNSRLPFGGGDIALQEGEQPFNIIADKVKVGDGEGATVLTIAPTDKLTVRVSWVDNGVPKHAEWPTSDAREVEGEADASTYTRFLKPAPAIVFRPTFTEVTTLVAGSTELLNARQPEQRIVIDVANRTWYGQEKTSSSTTYSTRTDRLAFKPKVGTDLQFRFINYDPTKERASIETEYADLHLELQDRFAALMDPGSIKAAGEVITPSGSDGAAIQTTADEEAVRTNGLRDDLQGLFYDLQKLDAEDKVQDRMGLKRIKQRVAMKIKEYLSFDPDEKDAWEAKAQEIATNAQMNQQQATALAGVMLAAESYYKSIESVGAHNQFPLRIESMDELKVSIKIFEGTGTTPVQSSSFSLWNKGGIKIDFSAGFMGTWLIDDAFTTVSRTAPDTTFYVNPDFNVTDSILAISDVTTQHIKQTNTGNFRIGAGLMSHVYWRWGGWFHIGAAAGFMVSNDQPVNYLLGGSFLLGRKSRFAISGGWAFGQVERLATGYSEGTAVTIAPGGEVPTEQRWQNNYFVAVGMNFASAKVAPKPSAATRND